MSLLTSIKWGALWLTGASLVSHKAPAQLAPALPHARVYTVQRGYYNVPQVALPNAVVARRINQRLARLLVQCEDPDAVDSLATLPRQLQQAKRASDFDENKQLLANSQGFIGCSYTVLLNQGGLLSLAYQCDFRWNQEASTTGHVTFDLRTGRPLRLAQLVADSATQLQRRMQAAINRRLKEHLAEITEEYGDSVTVAYVADRYGWDWATKSVGLTADLSEFALTPKRLLLFYKVDFQRINAPFQMDETYQFSYNSLKPSPLLKPALAHPTTNVPR
ncbi:MAG: hypothetical protein EOO63_14855 [Hymenobacter sp.]|nr:MAG: hypothetical protein EOO63_14855 [Hymenobacter sp.]